VIDKLVDLEKRLKDLEDYVYNFDDFLPARSLVDKAKNYIEKLETVSSEDLTKRFHIPEVRAKKLIELFIEYGFLVKDEKGDLKTNKEAFQTFVEPPFFEGDEDSLFDKGVEIVMTVDKASASLLQRRLSIGYARAARMLDQMEAKGIVGPAEGAAPRQVIKRT
jgi:DNA segregation ATPase FtsK/SpoIIIE-like protein